jgi:hypothetical protein
VYVQGRLTTESYSTFFHHISTKMVDGDVTTQTVGSDDNAALRRALSCEYPGASTVVCGRHLKEIFQRHLRDEFCPGNDSAERRRDIMSLIFGTAGLSAVSDLTTIDHDVSYTDSFASSTMR